jgi:hypothetical protein
MGKSQNGVSARDPAWAGFPGVWAMMEPSTAYQWMAGLADEEGIWTGTRKPIFLAIVLGCVASLLAAERLTLRVAGSGTIYASFVPLVEILALFVVRPRNKTFSFSRAIDLFFTGHGPWILWLIGFAAFWTFTSPSQFFADSGVQLCLCAAGIAALWSGYIDFCFFRRIHGENRGKAMRSLVLHRAISWTVGFTIFGGGSLWPEIVRVLRL